MEAIDCEIENRDGDTITMSVLQLHSGSSAYDQIELMQAVRPKTRPLAFVRILIDSFFLPCLDANAYRCDMKKYSKYINV